ncbi:MAG: hypothetical protein ABI700_08895 [Chloroflexota bacterium]
MSDLPPFDDDDDFPFEPDDDEKPKRRPILDDGELPFEVDVEKPKKRPPSPWWRKTYIPIPLLLAICALLICSVLLLLSTSLTNGALLCRITPWCNTKPVITTPQPTLGNDPRPPLNEPRVAHFTAGNGSDTTYDSTVTPAPYRMSRCDLNADYPNYLMFTMGAGDNAEIFLMTPQGRSVCRLTENLIEEKKVNWSPDRKHILFVSQRSGDHPTDLYVMNFDGTNIVNLTQDQAEDYEGGVWSPDGTQIAFSSNRSGKMHVFVMNADGANVYDLTPDAFIADSPTWSPDGTQIAYIQGSTNNGNTFEVYTTDLDSKATRALTTDSSPEYLPAWSPLGESIILYANTVSELGDEQGTDLYSLQIATKVMTRLTYQHGAESPSWSPDGKKVVYLSDFAVNVLDMTTRQIHTLKTVSPVTDTVSWR